MKIPARTRKGSNKSNACGSVRISRIRACRQEAVDAGAGSVNSLSISCVEQSNQARKS
ncbi:hypothetical protein SAMN05216404_11190 [Nitrosospira multiformis]|uniref:Uncharacterized protein n=1 Tax=Nitrosospira multiformis TaxID=1231 RepID=A0A1H8LYK1_9PROT|nr:hypothetical protein SAMN05216404_11190 [Nitrosospira multiformis]SET55896.1 hypothetical protein SAMN05216412_10889 [Nitrosospira multiformis]